MSPPVRLLTFSSLYPNAAQPTHGVFVENRLRHLLGSGAATSTVLAPVPWFPSTSSRFGAWAAFARAPREETRHGIAVHHPRFPVIPRVGMSIAPWLLYRAALPAARRLLAAGVAFDAIDAHYVYPDGVAAVWLGRALGQPVVITARGTDVNLIPRYAVPRRLIQGAIAGAAALIAVSGALAEALTGLGAPAGKVTVLRNGVDLALFHPPADRAAARAALGLAGPTLISVGHLIERKGHDLVIEALARLPDWSLLIVGEGPERAKLEALAARPGLAGRVRLLGGRPHAELPTLYGAADVLVLASSREGWANVLLESMACGTPVVASDIWGNPEVVRDPEAGRIVPRTAEAIAAGVAALAAAAPARAATRAYAEGFSWDATTEGQLALFRRVITARSLPYPAG
ncbi:MAG TPA: glycosyltransferase family 4 protein [Acetobacteraceae bacterium]|nr:glycosyltransferase family 4 protein [Acetobacteraceae bacterium]